LPYWFNGFIMGMPQKPLIEEWPVISFKEFENYEIENETIRYAYKSFFVFMRLPEIILTSFVTLLKEDPL